MSYMNDDTDPFGVPYAPIINQNPKKEIKEESPERFTYSGCIVYDKFEERKHHRYYGMGMPETVKLLNSLSVENEQLKNSVDILDKVRNELIDENEELKQFQDRVFSWIDMHLQRLPTLIDDEFNSDNEFADPSLYSGALQILETMKKELKGDME